MGIQFATPQEIVKLSQSIEITEDCWLWKGKTNNAGYGYVNWKWSAHRLSYRLFNGEIPDGLWVLHTCDVRICCNPLHLFVGTALDNRKDMLRKNRQGMTGARGSKNPHTKLTIEKARKIREVYKQGGTSHQLLANEYGVTKRAITMILNNLSWNEDKYDYDEHRPRIKSS